MVAEDDEKIKGEEESKGVDKDVHGRIGCLRRKEKKLSIIIPTDRDASGCLRWRQWLS